MKKIVIYLATILNFVACSNSNIDNQNNLDQKTISILEKCEVITVYQRTGGYGEMYYNIFVFKTKKLAKKMINMYNNKQEIK